MSWYFTKLNYPLDLEFVSCTVGCLKAMQLKEISEKMIHKV